MNTGAMRSDDFKFYIKVLAAAASVTLVVFAVAVGLPMYFL